VAESISEKLSEGSQLIKEWLLNFAGWIFWQQGQTWHERIEVFVLQIGLDKVLQIVAKVETVLRARLCQNFKNFVDLGSLLFLLIDDWRTTTGVFLDNVETIVIFTVEFFLIKYGFNFFLLNALLVMANRSLLKVIVQFIGLLTVHLKHIRVDKVVFKQKGVSW